MGVREVIRPGLLLAIVFAVLLIHPSATAIASTGPPDIADDPEHPVTIKRGPIDVPDLLRVTEDGKHVVRVPPPDGPLVWPFDAERELVVPPGFHVSVFAVGLDRPRFMAFGPDNTLYVTLPKAGRVVALIDSDEDGISDRIVDFAVGLDRPHGITFMDGRMFVAENHRLVEIIDDNNDHVSDRTSVISTDLPAGGGHWTRTVVAGPDRRLYVSAGSSCNSCVESDFRRASVLWFDPGGSTGYPFATGLRNTVGMAVHPDTGELWGVDNGRDWLGDDLPPEELNNIRAEGDYGWPYCFGARVPDPKLGSRKRCASTIAPAVEMQAHSAPLGIAFGRGLAFPAPYTDSLFIAFHGSWNRRVPTGYKLVAVRFKDGKPLGNTEDFIVGWKKGDADAWGRPVGLAVGPDGALYMSDDLGGVIYRITYKPRPESAPVAPIATPGSTLRLPAQ